MFVQVIRGRTSDPARLHAAGEQWRQELAPGAEGFLGVTAGVAADGEAVTIVRFADEGAARRNSERPEQGAWWEQHMAASYDGEPTFTESGDTDEFANGDRDSAGFVQVMEGTCADLAAVRAFEQANGDLLKAVRTDLLGLFRVNHADGRFTQAAYFSSEAAARAGEGGEPDAMPPELAEGMAAYGQNLKVERYLDLTDPQLF